MKILLKRRIGNDALSDLQAKSPAFTKFVKLHDKNVLVEFDASLDSTRSEEDIMAVAQAYLGRSDSYETVTLGEKEAKNTLIDTRTQELIAQGFAFDGHVFSLSPAAQMNWSGLKTFEALLAWPVKITANGDLEYSLAQANLVPFVGTALGTIAAHYTSGRALKLQVNAATTQAEIDAVVDDR